MYCEEKREVVPGEEGQLATILDLVVQKDNSVLVTCVGDLPFHVARAWLPRGLRGLQMALVDAVKVAPRLQSILESCESEPEMQLFAEVVRGVPEIAQMLASPGTFSVFVPANGSFDLTAEEILSSPRLESVLRCHIVAKHVPLEAMFSGRHVQAIDGTLHTVSFTQWPRGGPMVGDVPVHHMDIACSNGIIHLISGVLAPNPARGRPK
jgi:uncharacterized surface protein with fasciclin (FAS1) repeats